MPAAVDAETAGPMEREGFRSGVQGRRPFARHSRLSGGGAPRELLFHAGNCPAFYWLLIYIFENIPL